MTDNHFDIGFGVGSAIKGGQNPFAKIAKLPSDIWIGNFESVVATESVHTDYHKECFRIEPHSLKECTLIDYFGVANNHAMEHGPQAYNQMCDNLTALGKGVFGRDSRRSITFEHQGRRVSVTGFCLRAEEGKSQPLYWSYPECEAIAEECRALESDFKVVYIHWGVEFIDYPSQEQVQLAHWLVDIGFDLVVGMHPHIMQGYELYKGKHIFYSIGNFVFNMSYLPTKYSCIVGVDVATGAVSYDYVKIDENYCPEVVAQNDVPQQFRFETLNSKVGRKVNAESYIAQANIPLKRYRRSHHLTFIKNLHRYRLTILLSIVTDFIKRRFGNGN